MEQAVQRSDPPRWARATSSTITVPALLLLLGLTYLVLVGATNMSELSPELAVISAAIAIPIVVAYLWLAPKHADRLDKLVLIAVLLFLLSCLLSRFPRQSFEPALAAVVYASSLFLTRGFSDRTSVRIGLIRTFMGLSAVMTILTAARWTGVMVEWLNLTGWQGPPPFTIELPSFPWGHRHDLALLVAMLYPAWWIGRPSPLRRVVAIALGITVAGIVIVDGSRTLWFAIVIASVAAGLMALRQRSVSGLTRRRLVAIGVAIALIGAVVLVFGGRTLLERATDLESFGWRTAMWTSLIDSWADHPLVGSGPGSFPWLLQDTGYFDTNSFGPRHPDSAPIQLLAEGGMTGIAAVVVLVVGTVPAVVKGGSTAAGWALTAFAVAALASNPTEFAFLIVVAIAWLAYAVPRHDESVVDSTRQLTRRGLRAVSLIGAAMILVAWVSMTAGSAVYREARQSVAEGDLSTAERGLAQAGNLDPSLALYVRERGILAYLRADYPTAEGRLRRATRLNPEDDLAWRALTLAHLAQGNRSGATQSLDQAIAVRRSDPTNLLLRALIGRDDATDVPFDTAVEIVQAWPQVVLSTGWSDYAEELGLRTEEVLDGALRRWAAATPAPEPASDQGIWLEALAGDDSIPDRAVAASDLSPRLAAAMAQQLTCRTSDDLDDPSTSENQSQWYWRLVARERVIEADDAAASRARDVVELMARRQISDLEGSLNPLRENAVRGTSTDLWGYRRPSVNWPDAGLELPSPNDGLANWLEGTDCGS